MLRRKQTQKGGSTLLEFTLVGIPIIFTLISTFELARGMWTYATSAYAIKEATRYVVVRGRGCTTGGNSCGVTVGNVANQIARAGIGLDSGTLNVTLTSASGSVTCNPLSSCLSNGTAWPPATDNAPGADIQIAGQYGFRSALSMFWPGAGKVPFATIKLPAYSRQAMQF